MARYDPYKPNPHRRMRAYIVVKISLYEVEADSIMLDNISVLDYANIHEDFLISSRLWHIIMGNLILMLSSSITDYDGL